MTSESISQSAAVLVPIRLHRHERSRGESRPALGTGNAVPYISSVTRDEAVICRLPKESLRPLAVYHRGFAKRLLLRAAELDRRDKLMRQAIADVALVAASADLVRGRLKFGEEVDEAIKAVAFENGFMIESVEHYWAKERRRLEAAARQQRNREIMRLAACGWTNKRLALRFGMHKSSIGRVISGRLSHARRLRSP